MKCPKCADTGGDTSEDNLVLYENGSTNCFACGYHGGKSAKKEAPLANTLTLIEPLKGEYIDCKVRKISKSVCEKWGALFLRDYLGEQALAFPYYKGNTLGAYHVKPLSKRCKTIGNQDACDWFGSRLHGDPEGKTIVITEGHEDCMVADMVVDNPNYHFTSLPHGIGTVEKFIRLHEMKLNRYKNVVVCFDNTPDGAEGVEKFIKVYNKVGRVRIANLRLKDANDMHKAGLDNELKWAILKAETFKPNSVVTFDDIMDKILEKPKPGRPWPWPGLTNIDHGFYPGKTYIIGSATDVGKCLHPETPVIMSNGRIKKAKEIEVGDTLMGPDSLPRRVLSLGAGRDIMYKVTPKKGDSYIVNSEHILTLCATFHKNGYEKGKLYDIPLKKYLQLTKDMQRCLKSYRAKISLPDTFQQIDPYIYGLWLGDGTTKEFSLTNIDSEIIHVWRRYIESHGGYVGLRESVNRCTTYRGHTRGQVNPLLEFIRTSVKNENEKFIRDEYLYGSEQQRLDLLAGLLDSDGYLVSHGHTYEITTKHLYMSEQILYLCRSLGFIATWRIKKVKDRKYYRIFICGDIGKIPVILERKKGKSYTAKKNPYVSAITIERLGEGDYNGFTLDGDGRFLLGDFQVTHNTTFIKDIVFDFIEKEPRINVGAFFLEHRPVEVAHKLLSSRVREDLEQPDTAWWDKDELLRHSEELKKYIFFYDPIVGIELKEVINAIYYFVNTYHVQAIILDNLTILSESRMVDGKILSVSDYLEEVAKQFNKLKRELGVSFFIISHLAQDKITKQAYVSTSPKDEKKYMSTTSEGVDKLINRPGLTWETGRMPSIENLHYGATAAKLANEVIVLARDTTSEDDTIFRTTRVKVLKCKQRRRGSKPEFKVIYNPLVGKLEPYDD